MARRKLLEIGARFGKLTVIERVPDLSGHTAYKCRCDCDNTSVVRASCLRLGASKSCGCLRSFPRRLLEIGERFGKLTVIERAPDLDEHTVYLCQCDCGNTKVARAHRLRSGVTKSCGCLVGKDGEARRKLLEIGERFGKLTVVERAPDRNGGTAYLCQCDCGNTTVVRAGRLRRGQKSCGCAQKLEKGESGFRALLANYREDAEKRGLAFDLSKEEFRELVTSNCFYCGVLPSSIKKTGSKNGAFIYNGVDRMDSSLGYEKGNVVTCCKMCNWSKHTRDYDEWIEWLDRLVKFRGS